MPVRLQRPCLEPGCPDYATRTRCTLHERERDRRRGTTTERGYGAEHQRARDELRRTLPTFCFYCGVAIEPGDRFDACHVVDGEPASGWVAGHPACNQANKARKVSA